MILELIVSLITLACIVAFVVWLAMQPQKRILQIAVPVFIASFAVIYGFYLAAHLVHDDPVFGIPTAFSSFVGTFESFTNGVAYSDVAEAGLVQELFDAFWFETLFWALHMLVIITLAISGFAVFGRKLMDKVRLRLYRGLRGKDIYFIFGDSDGAIILGANIARENPSALVVFFSEEYTEELRERIAEFGGALIEVNEESRERYLDEAKQKRKENVVEFEGVLNPRVNGYSIADLLARYVVGKYPPYAMMDTRGDDGRDYLERIPARPYAAIMVGFGELGRACLRQLIMASQFTLDGSLPKFYVISQEKAAFDRFCTENPEIGKCARIEFLEANVYSLEAKAFIEKAVRDETAPLRQVYTCCAPVVGLDPAEREACLELNGEIDAHMKLVLTQLGWYVDDKGFEPSKRFINPCLEEDSIWTPKIVLHKELDKRAVYVNGGYDGTQDASSNYAQYLAKWNDDNEMTEFHRDSSRAAAAFMEAYFGLIGMDSSNQAEMAGTEALLEERTDVLDALAHIEHDRWNAFHYCNGYSSMGAEEFTERKQAAEAGEKLKPNQDFFRKRHLCLVAWDELPSIDVLFGQREGQYQDYDRYNIQTASRYLGRRL